MTFRYLVWSSLFMVSCQDTKTSEGTVKEAAPKEKNEVVPASKKDSAKSPKDIYKMQAEVLLEKIDSAPADEVATLSKELTNTGLSMLPALIQLHGACAEYLGVI